MTRKLPTMARNNDFMPSIKTGYWCDGYRNQIGENLQTCIEKYGWSYQLEHHIDCTGDVFCCKSVEIYICECKCIENAWTFNRTNEDGTDAMPLAAESLKAMKKTWGTSPYICAYDFRNKRQVARWSVKMTKRCAERANRHDLGAVAIKDDELREERKVDKDDDK